MFPTRVIRKGKRWGRALLVVEAIDCQQREVKRRYRGFVIVVIGIIIVVLILVFFLEEYVFLLVFVLRVLVFHVIIYVAMLYILGVETVHFKVL